MTGVTAAVLATIVLRRHFPTLRWLWLIPTLRLAAGTTSIDFVWGVVHDTVMRMLLLSYLISIWAVLLTRL